MLIEVRHIHLLSNLEKWYKMYMSYSNTIKTPLRIYRHEIKGWGISCLQPRSHPPETVLFMPVWGGRSRVKEGAQLDQPLGWAPLGPQSQLSSMSIRAGQRTHIKPLLFTHILLAGGMWSATTPARNLSERPRLPSVNVKTFFSKCTEAKFALGNKQLKNHLWQPEVIYNFFLAESW